MKNFLKEWGIWIVGAPIGILIGMSNTPAKPTYLTFVSTNFSVIQNKIHTYTPQGYEVVSVNCQNLIGGGREDGNILLILKK